MTFNKVRSAHRQGQRRRPQAPALSSAILTVTGVDPEAGAVMVRPAPGAAERLGLPAGESRPLEVRPGKSRRQPNLNDLLGTPGGNSTTPMKVGEGNTIIADSVSIGTDGAVSTSWPVLGSGPKADASYGGPATVLEGVIRTAAYRNQEDETRFKTEIAHPAQARAVSPEEGVDGLKAALTEALGREAPGTPYAIIRVGNLEADSAGETLHKYVRRMPDMSVEESVDAFLNSEAAETPKAGLSESANALVEVIPASRIGIGATQQRELQTALAAQQAGDRGVTGAKKFSVAEIHPANRYGQPSGQSKDGPTEAQTDLVDALSQQRKRDIPPAVRQSRAAASAWIDQNRLAFGWAHGQMLVREKVSREEGGDVYDVAIASALHTRTGKQIEAIATPGSPAAPAFMRGVTLAAEEARQQAIAGGPAAEADAGAVNIADLDFEGPSDPERDDLHLSM